MSKDVIVLGEVVALMENEDKLPKSYPEMREKLFKPGTPLWNIREFQRRFGRPVADTIRPWRQWVGDQLKLPPSVEGYPTVSPAESLAPIVAPVVKAVSRRGRKGTSEDNFRLHVMALLIDAGLANSPIEAVAKLGEAGGWNDNQLITAKERLVGKYNAQRFQDERARIRESPDFQTIARLLRENRPE